MNLSRIVCGIDQKMKKFFWQHEKNNIFVLMFHEVIKSNEQPIKEWNFTIKEESFKHLLENLSRYTEFISVESAVSHKDAKGAVITFDDIYRSVYENAVPDLLERKIPFTVFITPDYLDKDGYLTSDELRILAKEPLCTVGYHTLSHVGMRALADEQSVRYAIDPTSFRENFGVPCEYFAYPYGSVYMCPKRIRRALSRSDYIAAFGTVHSGTNSKMIHREKYYIPRLNICEKNRKNIEEYIEHSML